MANYCPNCSASFSPFSSDSESFWLHAFPLKSAYTSVVTAFRDAKPTDLHKCVKCGTFGFVCPNCNREIATGYVRLSDGTDSVCSKCSQEVVVRNPNHLFGS